MTDGRGEVWIEAGIREIASSGVDGVRVEVLAKNLGVTKGGFYRRFRDRAALLEAMEALLPAEESAPLLALLDDQETGRMSTFAAVRPPVAAPAVSRVAIRDVERAEGVGDRHLRKEDPRLLTGRLARCFITKRLQKLRRRLP